MIPGWSPLVDEIQIQGMIASLIGSQEKIRMARLRYCCILAEWGVFLMWVKTGQRSRYRWAKFQVRSQGRNWNGSGVLCPIEPRVNEYQDVSEKESTKMYTEMEMEV